MKRDRQGARHRRLRDARRSPERKKRPPLWVQQGWPVCKCGEAPAKYAGGFFICRRGHEYGHNWKPPARTATSA